MVLIACLILAPLLGSFAALAADRLPQGAPIVVGRSHCDRCSRVLAPRDLVPILSYAVYRGKARCCGAAIGWHLPGIELTFLLLPLMAWHAGAEGIVLAASAMLGWILLTLALIDLRSFTLPDTLTLPLLPMGLALSTAGLTGDLALHTGAAVLGGLLVVALDRGYRFFRNRSGMGMGDAKLLAAAGAWTGVEGLLSVLVIACCAALLAVLASAGRKVPLRADLAIPFGPALALGFWLTWIYGPIVVWVWGGTLP